MALPLFRYNLPLLENFYTGGLNIYPYVRSVIPYFYALDDLYIVGADNVFFMNKQDINNIPFNKTAIELDCSIIDLISYKDNYSTKEIVSNYLNYFYMKNKEYYAHSNSIESNSVRSDNITIKYNYNIKNYVLHQMFRIFMNTKKTNILNAITIHLNNHNDLNKFIYIINNIHEFEHLKKFYMKNELLFLMNIITNYTVYENMFHPNLVLDYISNNSNSVGFDLYEININTINKCNVNDEIKDIKLDIKGYDLKINYKALKSEDIHINTKYKFFVFVTDAKLDQTSVLWKMKELGLIYTMMFNTLDNNYTLIRGPSINPNECIKYLKSLCKDNNIKYSIISSNENKNIKKLNIK